MAGKDTLKKTTETDGQETHRKPFPELKVPLLYKCLHIRLESIPTF